MKNVVLLIMILIAKMAHSQIMPINKMSAYFFEYEDSQYKLDLCNSNRSFYYCIDSNSIIYWYNKKPFCPKDVFEFDTTTTDSGVVVKPRQVKKYESADFTLKFLRKNNSIYLLRPGTGKIESLYCKFDNSTNIKAIGLFDSAGANIRLMKSDTVIKFSNKLFHCYKIKENTEDGFGNYTHILYIDKKQLIPVYIVRIIHRNTDFGNKKPEINRFQLVAILTAR